MSLFGSVSTPAHAGASDETLDSRSAEIDDVKLHYLTAGHGPPLILLTDALRKYLTMSGSILLNAAGAEIQSI